MINKSITTSLLIVLFSFATQAQEKLSVGITNFNYSPNSATSENAIRIQNTVTNAFVKTKRFNIVDRSKMNAIKSEKELQKTEDFMDGSSITQGASMGADFLIAGNVTQAQAQRMESVATENGTTISYKAKLSIVLSVIDVSTGQVMVSETIEPKSGSMLGGYLGTAPSTPEAAISKAIKDIEKKIDDFVHRNFPVSFSIVEISKKGSNGEAIQIMISGGSAFGLKKGDKLKVVESINMEVNGKTMIRKKEIGLLKITKIEDENFSMCSVKKGGSSITSQFEAKGKITVLTL